MTVWICGNSHVGALRKGLSLLGDDNHGIEIFPLGNGHHETTEFSGLENGRVVLTNAEYAANLLRFTKQSHFSAEDVWGFCMGTHNARIYRHNFWVGAEPGAIAAAGKRPVSEAMLDAIIENDQKNIKAFIANLKNSGVRCFVVSCPPPRLDHACFAKGVRRQVVGYIDARARENMARWLGTQRVGLVEPPPEAYADRWFLKPALNAPDRATGRDAHHANPVYGRMMIQRVIAFLEALHDDDFPGARAPSQPFLQPAD